MLPLKPATPESWMVAVAELPGAAMASAETLGVTASPAPVPVSATDCGEPAALSVTVMDPVRAPVAVGVKVTLMAQDAPAATEEPQVLVCAKSPVAATPLRVSGA